MNSETKQQPESDDRPSTRERISGVGQVIIGEIETIGGVLTGDPTTRAEGEFNVEVGTVRENLEDDIKTQHESNQPEEMTKETDQW